MLLKVIVIVFGLMLSMAAPAVPEPLADQAVDGAPETPTPAVEIDPNQAIDAALDSGSAPAQSEIGVGLPEARSLYQAHLHAQQYDEALDVARYSLGLAEQDLGAASVELAPILTDLGNALLHNKQPEEALIHFERSVDLVHNHRGLFHSELVAPLMGQGYAQQELGRHKVAIDTFRRGQHIVHRNDGVLGLDQIPAIEAMATSLVALDEMDDAEKLRLLTYKIYRRKFGADDPRITPSLYSLASWYTGRSDFRQALVLYATALKLEQSASSDPLKTLPALQGMARIYSRRHGSRREGSRTLRQALLIQQKIVELLGDGPANRDRILAHLQYGDLLIRDEDAEAAWQQYRLALALVEQNPGGDWSKLFQAPKLLTPGPDLSYYVGNGDEAPYYDFSATIGPNGAPADIVVLGTNLHGQTRKAATVHFREARFRPRIVDNEPIATGDYKFRRVYPPLPRASPGESSIRF